jgi:hypothetical protein
MAVITTITTDLNTETTGHMLTAISTVGDITEGTTSTAADSGMEDFAAGAGFMAEAGAVDDGDGHNQ